MKSRPAKEKSIRIRWWVMFTLMLTLSPMQQARGAIPEGETFEKLLTQGKGYFKKGAYDLAARNFEQLISMAGAIKTPELYLDVAVLLAQSYQELGQHSRAISVLKKGLKVLGNSHDRYRQIQYLNIMSDLYLAYGLPAKAVPLTEKAIEKATAAKNDGLTASVMLGAANIFIADGDMDQALTLFEHIDAMTESLPNAAAVKGSALTNMSQIAYLMADDQLAALAMEKALSTVLTLPAEHGKLKRLIAIGHLSAEIHQELRQQEDSWPGKSPLTLAYSAFDAALKTARKLNNARMTAYAYGYLGNLYEIEKRIEDGLKLTRRAIFHAQSGHHPEILYLFQWQLGRLMKAKGDLPAALAAFKQAVETLDPIRREFFQGHRKTSDIFNRRIKPVYLGLAELYLDHAMDAGMGGEPMLRAARDTMERLKTAELQDYYTDECTTILAQKTQTLNRTPPKSALIYPIICPKKLALLVILPDSMHQVQVDIDTTSLTRTVTQYRRQLQNRMNNRFLYNAEKLYQWLIAPVADLLAAHKIDTLVIAPDGVLRLIPLSTLHNGKRFLIEDYAMAIIPAASLTDPKPLQSESATIMLGGLSEGRQGFSPLPSVTAELRDIKQIMAGRDVISNQAFTAANLMQAFQKQEYTIVHFATHGVFGGTPADSFLLGYHDRLTMDRLEAMIGLGRFRKNPVELLTLSACQTALGNERAALGLAGVAVKAGARSALATLWYVDDEATSLAVREFYRQLKQPGLSKAQALQNAQKKLIAAPRYWQPLYWAPFLLIGNWL